MQSEHQAFGDWVLLGPLGEGGFGEVHYWKNRLTGTEIATKSLKRNPKLHQDEIEILKRRWRQELKWMESLKISSIVGVLRLDDKEFLRYLNDQNPWEMLPVIVMEYCNGGDLRNLLTRDENIYGLSQYEILGILQTLRDAVEYLHNNCKIEHRDIKPENIVIHRRSNEVIYKLTDFGYAREIPENTIAQSVVGTRHYVAPEVIDPGCYTQTVDYWSVGVLAYEIICGIRPFIPHLNFRDILISVIGKPKNCIAITQRIDEPDANHYNFEEKLVRQNKCDPIFISKIEKWLCSALDKDYKTRGMQNGLLRFYTDLDNILKTRILSVYSIFSYKIHHYDIDSFTDLEGFFRQLSADTKIPKNYMYMTLPTSHPKRSLSNISTPQDFFVPEWADPSNPGNPPVMLYVSNITQCDFNVDLNEMYQMVPESISQCMKIEKHKFGSLPSWVVDQFERNLVFLLSEQQRLLKCHMSGIYEYVMSIEEDVFHYEPTINEVHQQVIMLCGRVKQFSCTVEQYNKTSLKKNTELIESSQEFQKDCETLNKDVTSKILKSYKSVSRLCKDLSGRTVYKTLPAEDIFNLNDFRLKCDRVRRMSSTANNSKLMNMFVATFDKWAEKIVNFSKNVEIKKIHNDIYSHFSMFPTLQKTVKDIQAFVKDFESRLDKATSKMFLSINNDQLAMEMETLSIDGSQQAAATAQSLVLTNGYCHTPKGGDIIDFRSTNQLIDELKNTVNDIKAVMDDDKMLVDIPTTIRDI